MKDKETRTFNIGGQLIKLYVPADTLKADKEQPHLLYWSKVWPAAIALSQFILEHPEYVENKTVLELAAGLGLPSLTAALKAESVYCTDYAPEAVKWSKASAALNRFYNMTCMPMDWKRLPNDLNPDTVLVSDMTYNPDDFDPLYDVISQLLQKGTTILISTPQRLMAKSFIERILSWCVKQVEMAVSQGNEEVYTSVLVLRIKPPNF